MKFTLTMIAVSLLWWGAFVSPKDEHLHAVAQCVLDGGHDVGDHEAWDECHNQLIGQAGGLVPVLMPPTN